MLSRSGTQWPAGPETDGPRIPRKGRGRSGPGGPSLGPSAVGRVRQPSRKVAGRKSQRTMVAPPGSGGAPLSPGPGERGLGVRPKALETEWAQAPSAPLAGLHLPTAPWPLLFLTFQTGERRSTARRRQISTPRGRNGHYFSRDLRVWPARCCEYQACYLRNTRPQRSDGVTALSHLAASQA